MTNAKVFISHLDNAYLCVSECKRTPVDGLTLVQAEHLAKQINSVKRALDNALRYVMRLRDMADDSFPTVTFSNDPERALE